MPGLLVPKGTSWSVTACYPPWPSREWSRPVGSTWAQASQCLVCSLAWGHRISKGFAQPLPFVGLPFYKKKFHFMEGQIGNEFCFYSECHLQCKWVIFGIF